MTKLLRNHDFHRRSNGRIAPDERIGDRRTLVRRRADPAQAGVLRGEISPFMGEVLESMTEHVPTVREFEERMHQERLININLPERLRRPVKQPYLDE